VYYTILVVLDFTKTFVLECDALGKGLGAMLMQEGHPLAFTNKQLCDKNLGKSTYEKEMMAILHVIDTWCTISHWEVLLDQDKPS
jgi:hypothetical protein